MNRIVYLAAIVAVAACDTATSEHESAADSTPCTTVGPKVSPSSATLHPGDTLRASASLYQCRPGDPVGTFRWLSSDTSVASVGATSGLIQARKGGTATISAAAVQDPNVKGAMLLFVSP